MKTSRLALVGQEDDGILLFAHDGYAKDAAGKASKRTFINMYDMKTRELTALFMHDYVIDVVSSSVNEERTLLVFTTLSRYRKPVPNVTETQDFEELYESRLVEVLSQRSMPIDKLSKSRQSVYFLGSDAKQKGWTRRRVFLLFVMHTHFAQVLHIQTTRRGPQDERVLKFAELFAKLVQKSQLAWHQYNAKEKTLYCLVAQNNKGTYDKSQDYTLRCYKLSGDRRNDVMFEVGPLQLAHEPPEMSTNPRMSMQLPGEARAGHRRSASQSFDARSAASAMSVKWTDNLQIVEMSGNAVCLCQQHPVEPNAFSPSINVSIFVLHHKMKLDFSIPMNGPNDAAFVTSARVFFDCIGDLLLVYVPGRYIQLIDCGDEHDPCPNLFFTGSRFATLLPEQAVEDFPPFVMPFDTMMSTASDYRRYGMLDVLKGVLYEYTFNREAVLNVFDLPSSDWHVYALHLAIVHMHDVELVDKIMRHMCTTRPEMVSTVLIKEYLIGTPYQSVKNKNMEVHLLSLLPVTSLESFTSDNLSKKIKRFISVSRLNIPVLASNRKLIRPTNRQRFLSGGSGLLPSVEAGNNTPTFRNLFMRILGIDESQNTGTVPAPPPPPPDSNVLAPYSASDRWRFIEALADYMFNSFPKENKAKCMAWAKDYRGEQIHQSNRLYEYIAESTTGFVRLQVLENLYYILEELSFPPPKGFTSEFATLGHKYLPRSVFMQYMERGVFHITEPFAAELFASLGDTPEDHEFKFAIISKLPVKEFLRALQKHPEFHQLLLEYFHSTLPIKFPSFQDLLNPRFIEKSNQQLQSTNNSFFLPVSIFLADLNSNYHQFMSGSFGDGPNAPGAPSPLVSPRSTPAIFLSTGTGTASTSGSGGLHGSASTGGIPIFAPSAGQHPQSGLASSAGTAPSSAAASAAGGREAAGLSSSSSSVVASAPFGIFSRPPPPPPPPPAHADGGFSNLLPATSVIRKVGFVNEYLMPTIHQAFERSQPLATPTATVTYNKKKPSP